VYGGRVALAAMAANASKWEELAGITGKILELDPYNYPGIYYFDAAAQYNLGHVDQAEASAREAVKLDKAKTYPGAYHILGVALAVKGELAEAAGALKEYLKLAPAAPDAAQARARLAQVERVAAARQAQTP
jgi:tetratricopeptide (TPR) repeat protein